MKSPLPLRIYGALPIALQNAAVSIAGYRVHRWKYSRKFRETLDFLEASQSWSLRELQTYQDERLRETIQHAYNSSPYYRRIMQERKLAPHDIRTAADLPKLPILDKQLLRRHYDEIVCQDWPRSRRVILSTGGTTGTSLKLVEDRDTSSWETGIIWRFRRRFGLEFGEPQITFGGRKEVVPLNQLDPPFWRHNLALRQTFVSVHHMTKANMAPLIEYLCRRKVTHYVAYPSAAYLIAKYMKEHGIRLPNPPRAVATNSESLLGYQRELIEEAMDTEVIDYYGLSEHTAIASECAKHRYHVDMEFGVMEFLPVDGAAENTRKIICTGLQNPAMPLIRYDTGDLATMADTPCDCGLHAPSIASIDGRIESYIFTPDGRQLGRLDHLFKGDNRILEAQFVQDRIEELLVRIVREDGYTKQHEAAFMDLLRAFVGDELRVTIEYMPEIPRTRFGKFRQVISNVQF